MRVEKVFGREFVVVEPSALRLLAGQAMIDIKQLCVPAISPSSQGSLLLCDGDRGFEGFFGGGEVGEIALQQDFAA